MTPALTNFARKTLSAGLAAALLATGFVATAPQAHAENGRNAALIGGLAAGALIGGAIVSSNRPAYADGYSYAPPPPPARVYYPAAPRAYYAEETYVQECYRVRRPVYDAWGEVVGWRRVRVCE